MVFCAEFKALLFDKKLIFFIEEQTRNIRNANGMIYSAPYINFVVFS